MDVKVKGLRCLCKVAMAATFHNARWGPCSHPPEEESVASGLLKKMALNHRISLSISGCVPSRETVWSLTQWAVKPEGRWLCFLNFNPQKSHLNRTLHRVSSWKFFFFRVRGRSCSDTPFHLFHLKVINTRWACTGLLSQWACLPMILSSLVWRLCAPYQLNHATNTQ